MRILPTIIALSTTLFCQNLFAAEKQPDLEALQGTWEVASAVFEGKQSDFDIGLSMTFASNKVQFARPRDPKNTYGVEITLDETTNPKRFDYTWRNFRVAGIYRLDGGSCVMSHRVESAPLEPERPTDFVSDKGNKNVVLVLTRGK